MAVTLQGSQIVFNDNSVQASAASNPIPSGTVMLFVQTSSPTGWTKNTTHNDKALRVVSGTASSGGSVAFSTAFASGLSAGSTTLDSTQIPSHTHSYMIGNGYYNSDLGSPSLSTCTYNTRPNSGGPWYVANTGGGGSHNHSLPSFQVQYVDTIIASKD